MEVLKAAYSKSEEYSTLRTSLLPGLLQAVKGNLAQKNFSIAAFEIGRIHFLQKGKVIEIPVNGPFKPSAHMAFHPGRQADIFHGDLAIGSFGEVHPSLLAKFDIDQRVYYAEINLTQAKKTDRHVTPLPQFPSSERDWTLPLEPKTAIATVFNAIYSFKSPILEKVELIDLYHPETAAQKNGTLRFTYRDPLKTVSFEEVESEHEKMMSHVANLLSTQS